METALTAPNANRTELAQFGEMSVQTIIDRKRKIREVLEAVMVEGEHYGKIPGCGDKPSLFKAGAEVLATTFGLAPRFKITRNDLPNGHREYEFVCELVHIATGAIVGEGVGTCSTMESKYRWRKGERKCPNCGKAAIIKGKAEFGGGWVCWSKKGGCDSKWKDGAAEIEGQQTDRVENADIADTYNTVLKIAKKRAQVDCTLTGVGASDVLTQDLEDLPPGSVHVDPAPRSNDAAPVTGGPVSRTIDAQATEAPNEDAAQDAALELMADLQAANTPDEVRALSKKFNALPKGSRARSDARIAFDKRLAEVHEGAAS